MNKRCTILLFLACALCLRADDAKSQTKIEQPLWALEFPLSDKGLDTPGYRAIRYLVTDEGIGYSTRYIYDWAFQNTKPIELTKAEMTRVTQVLEDLSKRGVQAADLDPSKRLVIKRLVDGRVTEVVFSRHRLPRELKEVIHVLGGLRRELEGEIKYEPEQSDAANSDSAAASSE